ncbi:Predicted nuclease of the RNAse H fold, HicB family [Methylobacterium sp. 174MFSha1.1]|uniref:type II toxin-antitoxin system HicB family antitoxin n=1 Tax=Methylobacterium sp. 174MFSha1.1 TaxID=1502749 RepID=UPI0008E742AE|nr:type II toxin-antitoxin system HicB family antitoxin [Methylobacterium sp. 174MFSha1.1]SFU95687.1 Predicted nuclease of the RNAse H fold, HicB family [Methylobacterium sp. 174MFSha1.1]
MTAYIGILEKEPGTLWGLWFPDLPGCIAAGASADDTLAQGAEALAQWAALAREDGTVLPAPRSVEALRSDPDVAAALASGHVAVAVRPPADELGLDDAQLQAVDRAAERRGLTRSGLVRALVLDGIAG